MWLMNIFRHLAEFIHILQLNYVYICSAAACFVEYLRVHKKK